MTGERREEVLLIAVIASLAVHIVLVLCMRAQVLARPGTEITKPARRGPMHLVERAELPDPAKIDEILDLDALKDAPPIAAEISLPRVEGLVPNTSEVDKRLGAPEARIAEVVRAPEVATAKFEERTLEQESLPQVPLITRIETPSMAAGPSAPAPEFTAVVPSVAKTVDLPVAPTAVAPLADVPRLDVRRETVEASFTPAATVYEKVDEKIVSEEEAAVRQLMNADQSADLHKFVNVTMTSAEAGGWRYFKVMMVPRNDLRTVPKDVVIVIDGSGSIGKDRFANCRKVAQKIMRSCMNSGDRFNLVVFRNAFSYAFRSWQECDARSFAAGDKWLDNQTAHGRTDVFSTISSILTLPRDPKRPLVALVVTDGDANAGVSDTAEILSKFTALNDGLVSVYMYGVKSSANRELIDLLTHGNRGESFIFEGWRWNAGDGLEELSERFRDPVLSDLRVIFAAGVEAEAYPRLLRNIYRGGTLEFVGRVPAHVTDVSFSLRGLNGDDVFEGFFRLPLAAAGFDPKIVSLWQAEAEIARKTGAR